MPYMKCGHFTTARDARTGRYVCPICVGFTLDAEIVEDNLPDLTGRKAMCPYCKTIVDSSFDLPFFNYLPDKKYDSFYCGCRGWD